MSTNKSIQKQAKNDAYEYAAAHMAYGEGAGTRRKLIEGAVGYKMQNLPGYREAFETAASNQNMVRHASQAKKDDRRRKVNTAVSRNTKAALSGKYENLNTGLLILGGTAAVLYKTGYDKKLVELGREKYKELRQRYSKPPRPEKSKKSGDDKVHRITNVE